jgi:monovalent cation:H+ antiporter, CPA1 family
MEIRELFCCLSKVQLLIGDQIHFAILGENLRIIAVTIVAMIVMRALSVYGLSSLSNRLVKSEIPPQEQTILWWGGLRGSVAIALALSIPVSLPERESIIATVFGVVLFTLLVQGLTVKPLLEKLNLLGDRALIEQYTEAIARYTALDRALQYLNRIDKRPGIEPEFVRYQETLITGELNRLKEEIEQLQNEYPDLQNSTNEQLRQELMATEADSYAEFVQAGYLNKELAPFLQQE